MTVERFGGESSEEEIERLASVAKEQGCDVVVGMGGGKAIDTAKAVGYAVQARVAIVPTIASTDAPTSAVAVIYTAAGAFLRYLFLPRNPDLVLVDTQVIAEAPVRYLVAGMGDALSTWFEADACRTAYAPNQCGGLGTLAGYALARLCYDTIREYGLAARIACARRWSPRRVACRGGQHAAERAGIRDAGLAAAHSIHNGLTRLPATHAYFHGEKVALGVLASLFLTDRPSQVVREVYDFCESVGLPTTLADVGFLAAASDDDLRLVAEAACGAGETIHHEPCPVSAEAVVAALKTADQYGHSRKK